MNNLDIKSDVVKNNKKKEELVANINKLESFLKSKQVSDSCITHTKIARPGGSYSIINEDLATFYKLYSKVVNKTELNIVERPMDISPFLIDIDFDTTSKKRIYTIKDIRTIIRICNRMITDMFHCPKSSFKMFILEKEKPSFRKEGVYKDGFHIIYPSIGINTYMRYYLLDQLTTELEKRGMFSDTGCENTYNNIVDKSIVISNGMTMYGSNKFSSQKYELTYILNYKMEEEKLDLYSDAELVELMSNRRYINLTPTALNKDFSQANYDKIIENMENKYAKKTKKVKEVVKEEIQEDDECFGNADVKAKYENLQKERLKNKDIDKDIELAKKLAAILSKERASGYHSWLYVGWALHNISSSLLNTFKTFSKKCGAKYDSTACDNVWAKAKNSGFAMPSLHKWARADNNTAYLDIIRSCANELFVQAENGCDYDIAKLIYELYKYTYKCVSIKHSSWYEFQNHRWVEIEGGYTLNIRISESLTMEFTTLLRQYVIRSTGDGINGFEKDNYDNKMTNIRKLINKLRRGAFKSSIMDQCKLLFLDKKFEEKLDANKDLLGFDNGVYDLKGGYFREGMPDDFITFSVGYDYENYTIDHPYVKEVLSYFHTIQRESPMKEYLLILLSSYISGHNKDQQFIIWTGVGSNGKSKTLEFCKMAFGDYSGTLPITLLTGKRSSAGTASPEIADTKGKRLVVFQEPENDDVIHVGYMKELSGSDPIPARKLFRDPFTFIPQFKMVLTCNKLPTIPSTDEGTWRRIRVTPFESKFIDVDDNGMNSNNGKPLKDDEFPKRFDFEDKMQEWKAAFMWLLIHYYKEKYVKCNIKNYEPEKVKSFTKNYKKSSDIILEFVDTTYVTTEDKKKYVRITDMYSLYKEWFKTTHAGTGHKQIPAVDFKKYFTDKEDVYKIINGTVIRGLVIKGNEIALDVSDDEEEEDELA